MRRPFSLLACALLGATLLVSLVSSAAAQGPPPVLVRTSPVVEMEFHDQLTLVGRSEARAESRIVAEVVGRAASINAEEGRKIRRGAPLLTLDCRRTELALEAKRAEAGQARAAADLARKELERAQDLVRTAVIPERTLDSAKAESVRADERSRQFDAEIRRLELDLENCTIRAPYDGYTLRRLVDVGEWVEVGTPVWEMVDLSVVRITVDLPERRFGELELGGAAEIRTEDGTVLQGEVTGIARRASEATHTFPVLISVDNRDGKLAGGMLVRAVLDLRGSFSGLAISKDAIVRQDDRTSVFTVADGAAVRIPVTILAGRDDMVAVEGDLSVGQELVVRGNERLFPGAPVRTE